MRIVIADDAVLLREGAARLLEDAGFEVVAQAGDAEDLLRKVRAHKPDVAVIDIRMPPDNVDDGLRAALEIRSELPNVGLLLLSQYVEERYLSWPTVPGASATCSRTAWPTSSASPTPCAGSPRAAPCSIPRSWPKCSAGASATSRWTS